MGVSHGGPILMRRMMDMVRILILLIMAIALQACLCRFDLSGWRFVAGSTGLTPTLEHFSFIGIGRILGIARCADVGLSTTMPIRGARPRKASPLPRNKSCSIMTRDNAAWQNPDLDKDLVEYTDGTFQCHPGYDTPIDERET